MKIKRYKQARHILNFYKRNFGIREPYQIIGMLSQGHHYMNVSVLTCVYDDLYRCREAYRHAIYDMADFHYLHRITTATGV